MKSGTGWECFGKGEREPRIVEMFRISETSVSSSVIWITDENMMPVVGWLWGLGESPSRCCPPRTVVGTKIALGNKIPGVIKLWDHNCLKEQITWIDTCGNLLLLLLSRFSYVRLCATPQTAAHQAPPSLGFSRQEHRSGLPFPSLMHESEVKVKSLSLVRLLATPWTAAHQAPLFMGFSRQEYWSGVPLPRFLFMCLYFVFGHMSGF